MDRKWLSRNLRTSVIQKTLYFFQDFSLEYPQYKKKLAIHK
jgi:hypothetical protein